MFGVKMRLSLLSLKQCTIKQLLDSVFVISEIIKVEVRVFSRSRRLWLITLTETLIILDITKTSSNNCLIVHCFKDNNDKRIITPNSLFLTSHVLTSLSVNFTLLLEIMHCVRNLQIIHLSASRLVNNL